MAGIYVHIPFCKVKCHYCDFHFSVQLKNKNTIVNALCAELIQRKLFLNQEEIKTIYFGGGTPSVLEVEQINTILQNIKTNYLVHQNCEITLECNPDDLDEDKLKAFKQIGINRLSIGIQSFNDQVLKFMNRAHNSAQAFNSIKLAQKFGFENITIDLIYGIPGSSLKTWQNELDQIRQLNIPHLSAYCLTIEKKTVFGNWQKKGKLKPFSDEESLKQFQYLIDFSKANGYEQYEISNFSKKGFISKHNSAYWLGEKYLGIGPSAHSYNGTERSWNIANNIKYAQLIEKKEVFYETEKLSKADQFNEYILTRLRTKWGIDLVDLEEISKTDTKKLGNTLLEYIAKKEIQKNGTIYTLTNTGKFIADAISADLFC